MTKFIGFLIFLLLHFFQKHNGTKERLYIRVSLYTGIQKIEGMIKVKVCSIRYYSAFGFWSRDTDHIGRSFL